MQDTDANDHDHMQAQVHRYVVSYVLAHAIDRCWHVTDLLYP